MSAQTATPSRPAAKWVYLFSELDAAEQSCGSWDGVRGAARWQGRKPCRHGSHRRARPTGICCFDGGLQRLLAEGAKFPAGMWEEELLALRQVESLTGKRFGDPQNPLLVSCRSGPSFRCRA